MIRCVPFAFEGGCPGYPGGQYSDSGGLQAPVAHPPSAPNASAATLTSEARRVGVADTAVGSRGDGSGA